MLVNSGKAVRCEGVRQGPRFVQCLQERIMSEQELVEIVAGITDADEMGRFLQEILTEKERHVLALRWKLLKDLHAGRTQRSIAADYRISLCKITRGSKILKERESVIRRILDARDSKKSLGNENHQGGDRNGTS